VDTETGGGPGGGICRGPVFDPSIQSWILKHPVSRVGFVYGRVFDPSIQSWILKHCRDI